MPNELKNSKGPSLGPKMESQCFPGLLLGSVLNTRAKGRWMWRRSCSWSRANTPSQRTGDRKALTDAILALGVTSLSIRRSRHSISPVCIHSLRGHYSFELVNIEKADRLRQQNHFNALVVGLQKSNWKTQLTWRDAGTWSVSPGPIGPSVILNE